MSALDEIVKNLIGEYDAGNLEDASLAPVIKRIREGKATYGDVERLASRTGTRAGRLIAEQLAALSVDGRVTEEQARALLMGLIRHNYDVVSGAAADVQESLNRRAGLGLKAVRPEFNRDRVEGLITEVVGKEDVPAFKNTLVQQVENVSMATVDDSVKVNAKAHYNAGLSPKIVRVTNGKCCKWCDALAGVHEYSQVNDSGNDVFRRHANCGCQVLYNPADGKKWQDVHTKRLLSAAESAKIKARRTAGLNQRQLSAQEREVRANYRLSALSSKGGTDTTRYELGPIPLDRAGEAVDYFRNQIRDEAVEHAIVIDRHGNVIHFIGSDKGVDLFDVDLDGAYILHNHPASNGYVSFGEDDFEIIRDNPSCIFDVCNDKYDYHLEVTGDMSKLSYNAAMHMVEQSLFEVAEQDEDFQHIVMEALKERGYISYERRKK